MQAISCAAVSGARDAVQSELPAPSQPNPTQPAALRLTKSACRSRGDLFFYRLQKRVADVAVRASQLVRSRQALVDAKPSAKFNRLSLTVCSACRFCVPSSLLLETMAALSAALRKKAMLAFGGYCSQTSALKCKCESRSGKKAA